MAETKTKILETWVQRGPSRGTTSYWIKELPVEFSSAGTVSLSFTSFRKTAEIPTYELWDRVRFNFQGKHHNIQATPDNPGAVIFSDSPNSITWTLPTPDEGLLSLEFMLCEQAIDFHCTVWLQK
jgi:hypothetical protein